MQFIIKGFNIIKQYSFLLEGFVLTAFSDPYYTKIYNHVIKYHLKNKKADKNNLRFDDLDLPGQRIMQKLQRLKKK